jgi:hypothetical protein
MLLQGLGCAIGVQGIVSKAIDMLGLVRTECGASLRVRWVTFLQRLSKSAGYGHQRMKGEQVGNSLSSSLNKDSAGDRLKSVGSSRNAKKRLETV